jgi:hypothetical protein
MTIDGQLRDLARRADERQRVITADEIVQRTASGRHGSLTTRSGSNGQIRSLGDMTIPFIEEEATMIDLDSETRTTTPGKRPKSLLAAGILAAAAVVAIALVATQPDDAETPSDQPTPTEAVPVLGSIPAGDAPIEAGAYLVPTSAWSVADFTVTFPEGWRVQDGHVYVKNAGDAEVGFHAVVVDEIWAESCAGSGSGSIEVGPGVDDLATALLQQPGPIKSEPVDTTFGGHPATRLDLTVPEGFDLSACNAADVGLQIWYSAPADMNFVLIDDHTASVYVLDIDGERQVFVTQHGPTTTDADRAELQAVLDSIRIESPTPAPQEPATTATASVPALGSIPAGDASIEAGTYLVPSSEWSIADFTVTFPAGWIVEYGHVYGNGVGDDEFGFHAVVVDEIWAEACAGSDSGSVEVGPGVDDLVVALLQQPGPTKSGPVDTTFGGHPATRLDLAVPEGFDLSACNAADVGMQIWYSEPAIKNFVLLDDHTASVYILDIDGERQVFVTQHGPTTTDADRAELQAVIDSIRIEA